MAETINTVHPCYGLPDVEEAEAVCAFWSRIAADPLAVVIVEPVFAEGEYLTKEVCEVAVFTTYALALEHARALDCHGAVVIPKRLDQPAWGNVAVN